MNAYGSHSTAQIIGFVQLVFNEKSERVPSYLFQKNNRYCAVASILVNQPGEPTGDYWRIEIWSSQPDDPKIQFLLQHCPYGKQVFCQGKIIIKKKKDKSYPTMYVEHLIGLSAPFQKKEVNA
jgi:hypothetical protein